MTDQAARRRRLLIVGSIVLAFLAGCVAGSYATWRAAFGAAHGGLQAARGVFAHDQEERLALAWNAGDMNEALAHARCAYEAEYSEGARWFDVSALGWNPFQGTAFQSAFTEQDRLKREGLVQAKIAVVLERLGRADEARERLAQAARTGGNDLAWWRKAGLATVGQTRTEGFVHPDAPVRR